MRGSRIENQEHTGIRVTADAIRIDPILVAPIAAIPMLIILLVILLGTTGGKKKKKTTGAKKPDKTGKKPSGVQ